MDMEARPALPCSSDIYAVSAKIGSDGQSSLGADLWDAATGELLWTADCHGVLQGHFAAHVNKFVAIVENNGDIIIKVWDLVTGLEIMSLDGNRGRDEYCDVSSAGSRLLTWSYEPEALCVRDLDSGVVLYNLLGNGTAPCFADNDGSSIVILRQDSVHVLDVETGQSRLLTETLTCRRPVPSLDSHACIIFSATELAVWDVNTGNKTFQCQGYDVAMVCFANNSEHVVACWVSDSHETQHLTCWNIGDGSIVFNTNKWDDYSFMQFSALRSSIFLCRSDGTVRQLDSTTGRQQSCHEGFPNLQLVSVIYSVSVLM
jgi:WD40 repeat protein